MRERQLSFHERPRFVLYARGHRPPDVYPRIYVPVFEDRSKARTWLLKFLSDQDHAINGNVITIGEHTITCEQLTDVLGAPPGGTITDDEARAILRFKHGTWDEVHEADKIIRETVDDDGELKQVAIKPTKPLKVEKPKRGMKPDGYITIGELCEKWKITPLTARTCLRSSGKVKPPFGWAFAPSEVPEIKKLCGVT